MEIWIVACAAGMLLGRVGLALYACGLVRAKNAGGILLRHVADLCLAALGFWAIGLSLLNPGGGSGFMSRHLMFGVSPEQAALAPSAFLMLAATLLATGIVVGALAERSRFFPSIAPSLLLGAIGIPMAARWAEPTGWLGRHGFHDLGGASFIHLAAGACAAVGVLFVGPRNGKYNHDGSSNVIPGHSLPLACSGAMLLMVAWFPYLAGFGFWRFDASVFGGPGFGGVPGHAGMIALNTLLAGAAGGFASLMLGHIRYGKPDIYLTFSGIVAGLVSITAGADVMGNLSAVMVGAIAGLVIPWLMLYLDLVWKLDDPTGAVAIHGVGGAWSLIATALFASCTTFAQRFKWLGAQLLGLVIIAGLIVVLSGVVFFALKRMSGLRAREADEFDGLDLAEHDIGSYPDFQQTTIKSYHLREA